MFLTVKLRTYAKLNCLKYNCLFVKKMDLALNSLQKFICYKTKNQTKPNPLNKFLKLFDL